MRGFLVVVDLNQEHSVMLVSDDILDLVFNNYDLSSFNGKLIIDLVRNDSSVYMSEENYPKVKALDIASQYDLLRELYHTLKAEESIVDRENRIMELNNKITSNESITE